MASTTLLLLLSILLVLSTAAVTTANPFNITRLLGQFPDFISFNNYLTKTNIAAEINRRQTITVLAVDNDALGGLSGRSDDGVEDLLRLHVVLDYFDVDKLRNLEKKTTTVTTLFQASGHATGQMGFLNVTRNMEGHIVIGSAVAGSTVNAKLIKKVAAKPYNISVLQVSGVIVPKGNETAAPGAPPTKTPAASPKKAPATSPTAESPVDVPPPVEASVADAPVAADAPAADAPVAADAPAADTPVADAPEGDTADAPGPSSEDESSASHVTTGGSIVVALGIVALFFASF